MASFRIMGGNSVPEPVLLWENPNPTSAYSGGTIQISSYPYYIIEVRYSGSIDIIQTYILDINTRYK